METKYMESMIHRFNTLKQLEPLCAGVHRGSQTITVDAGSTGTRILITKEDGLQLNETFDTDYSVYPLLATDSEYAEVPITQKIQPATAVDKIIDKLEYNITNLNPLPGEWEKKKIVKGSLIETAGRTVSRVNSSELKIHQPQTVVNILCAIANTCLGKSICSGMEFEQDFPIDLSLGLPEVDLNSEKGIQEFKKSLAGHYRITMPRLIYAVLDENRQPVILPNGKKKATQYTIQFIITEDNIHLYSEQDAARNHYKCLFEYNSVQNNQFDALQKASNDIMISVDVGGRSTGMVMYKGFNSKPMSSITIPQGSAVLLGEIQSGLTRKFPDVIITKSMCEKALKDAEIKIGVEPHDVRSVVNEAKAAFARILHEQIASFADAKVSSLDDIARIIVSGRCFKPAIKDNKIISSSIKAYLENQLSNLHPNILVEYIGTDYPIPAGLMQCRIADKPTIDEEFEIDEFEF